MFPMPESTLNIPASSCISTLLTTQPLLCRAVFPLYVGEGLFIHIMQDGSWASNSKKSSCNGNEKQQKEPGNNISSSEHLDGFGWSEGELKKRIARWDHQPGNKLRSALQLWLLVEAAEKASMERKRRKAAPMSAPMSTVRLQTASLETTRVLGNHLCGF